MLTVLGPFNLCSALMIDQHKQFSGIISDEASDRLALFACTNCINHHVLSQLVPGECAQAAQLTRALQAPKNEFY